MNFVKELEWRGMIHDVMPGTEELFEKEKVTAYLGTDPSNSSMTVGNLASMMMLIHLQKAGHQPITLVGGATGMIGDPSGKSAERNLLSEEQLEYNVSQLRKQMSKLLDFDCTTNPALLVNNYDWFKDYDMLGFLRKIGKHLTLNYMISKESVKSRMETGISFTEFSYQLLQGYDFVELYKRYGCKVQLGGSDQWGNMTAGTELIRRMEGGQAFALTCPLITKSDGTKFGKSEDGAIWLDPEKTSPYKFYQFWLNASDTDAKKYIRIFTLMDREEIEALEAEHDEAPHRRLIQKTLGREVTTLVHSAADWEKAVKTSEVLFGKPTKETLLELSEQEILEVFDGVPTYKIDKKGHGDSLGMIDFLSEHTGILNSKGEARRSLKENSISINMEKVNESSSITGADLLKDKFILVQKGKKNKFLVIAE